MAKPFKELRDKMTPERLARVEARTQQRLAEMPLHELRLAVKLSRETLRQILELPQSSISKIEHQTEMYMSTLRRYVEAAGGDLEIRAIMPTGTVIISQLGGKRLEGR